METTERPIYLASSAPKTNVGVPVSGNKPHVAARLPHRLNHGIHTILELHLHCRWANPARSFFPAKASAAQQRSVFRNGSGKLGTLADAPGKLSAQTHGGLAQITKRMQLPPPYSHRCQPSCTSLTTAIMRHASGCEVPPNTTQLPASDSG